MPSKHESKNEVSGFVLRHRITGVFGHRITARPQVAAAGKVRGPPLDIGVLEGGGGGLEFLPEHCGHLFISPIFLHKNIYFQKTLAPSIVMEAP